MKIVKLDSGNYSVKYMDATGNMRATALKTNNQKEAQRLVKELKIEELEEAGRLGVLSTDVLTKIVGGTSKRFWDVVKEYEVHMRMSSTSENSIYTMMSIYEQFGREFKCMGKPMAQITEKNLYDFLNKNDGTAISMRALRKSSLSQLWNYAQIKMYVLSNPLMILKIDKSKLNHEQKTPKEREIFYLHEVEKIINHAPYFFKQATAISYWTGLRLGDIASLEWSSIKNRNKMVVWTEKRDKLVQIDLKSEYFGCGIIQKVLNEIDVEDKVYCFPEWHAIVSDPKTRSKPSVYFKRICERLDIYGRSFHCLRHSCITRLNKAGISLEEIGKVVGHSDTKTTAGYVHQ